MAEAPRTIGRYEILREIGRGSMGVVYEARDPVLDRTIALKVIQASPEGEAALAYEARFMAEARIVAALQHPGIVVIHDVGRDSQSGTLFIALELLRGETLADLAERGPLDWREVLRLVAQVARALGHAHRSGVVHRDVKPANVALLPTGEVKVMDFGIARLESARQHLTGTGDFIGTPLYAAPEQTLTGEVDGRADIFSLASVAYTLLTGQAAFAAPTIPGVVHRIAYEVPESPSRLVPELPPEVERILDRAMAKDVADRYPTAEAFAEDAEDLLAGRTPRHAAEDDLVVVEEADPGPEDSIVPPAVARTHSVPLRRAPRPRPQPQYARVLVAVAGIGLVAWFLWLWRHATVPAPLGTPPATAEATTPVPPPTVATLPPAVPPEPAPPPTTVPPEPAPPPTAATSPTAGTLQPAQPATPAPTARLRIDFDHPLERGTLRIFVDDRLALEQRLTGQKRKKALVFGMHEGSFSEELEVPPGLHEVRLEVLWDDNLKQERIVGNFRPGLTRRLEANLGRIRRDLNLEWK